MRYLRDALFAGWNCTNRTRDYKKRWQQRQPLFHLPPIGQLFTADKAAPPPIWHYHTMDNTILKLCHKNNGGEGWLWFPDLWSGQTPWWNWYLTSVVNFGEVRRAQLAKIQSPHLHVATSVPRDLLRSFKVCSDAKEKMGCGKQREATAPIQSLVKLQPCFLSLRWKTYLRQNCSLGFAFAVKYLPLGRTLWWL